MERATTDYLFILSLYDEPIPLGKLLFHLDASEKAEGAEYRRVKADLRTLEAKKLVTLQAENGACYVLLTQLGRNTANAVASTVADKMVADWQYRTPQPYPSYGRPA